MPVPKVKRMRHKSPDEVIKLHHVMYILRGMGYDVDDARSVICIIDMFNLDKSQFDFPYGSYEEFKKHVSELEVSDNFEMSDEEYEQFQKRIKEGQIWITY